MRLRWFPSSDYSWRDLLVIVKYLPEDSAYVMQSLGDDAQWGLQEQLMASAVDSLRYLVWFKTKDATKNINRPKPIPRPGVDDGVDREKIGGNTTKSMDDMRALLGMG